MTTNESFPATQPAAANLIASPEEFSYAANVTAALEGAESGPGGGIPVVGELVGQIVAHDGVESSLGHKTPEDVLYDIEGAASLIAKGSKTRLESLQYVTGTDGMRDAVDILMNDERTAPLLLTMRDQLKTTPNGITFTGTASMNGYLKEKARLLGQEPDSYSDIMRAVNSYVLGNGNVSPFRDRNTAHSNISHERERQVAFDQARGAAEADGIDTELLARSTEEVRKQFDRKRALAREAAADAISGASR